MSAMASTMVGRRFVASHRGEGGVHRHESPGRSRLVDPFRRVSKMLFRFPPRPSERTFRPLPLEDVAAELLVGSSRAVPSGRGSSPPAAPDARGAPPRPASGRLMLSARTAFRTPRRIRAPAPGEDQVPVAGVRRLGEVDHGAPGRKTGGRDAPADELDMVEEIPSREAPHDRDRRRVSFRQGPSARSSRPSLPGRSRSSSMPPTRPNPRLKSQAPYTGTVEASGNEPNALVVPEDPSLPRPGRRR